MVYGRSQRFPLVNAWAAHLALGCLVAGIAITLLCARYSPGRDLVDTLLKMGALPFYTLLFPAIILLCLMPGRYTVVVLDDDGIALERWGRRKQRIRWADYLGWREESNSAWFQGVNPEQSGSGGTTRTLTLLSKIPGEEIRVSASYPYNLGIASFQRLRDELDRRAPREGSGVVLRTKDLVAPDNPRAARWLLGLGALLLLPSLWLTLIAAISGPYRIGLAGPYAFAGDLVGMLMVLIGLFLNPPWRRGAKGNKE